MTSPQAWHSWAVTSDSLPPVPTPHVEARCHRRLRGPYTGAGALLRQIVPELLAHNADLVLPRATNIVAIAPELAAVLPLPEKTLTEAAEPRERTRFYSAGRTERLVHGVAELLMDWARVLHPDGVVVAFTDVTQADATDRELLTVLLRRCDPRWLTVVVELDDPGDDTALADAVAKYARSGARRGREPVQGDDLAQLYIDSDGTLDDEEAFRAYDELAPDERARRHTARAEELVARGEPSVELGAIPYHLERGTDRIRAGEALLTATTRCLELGYYHASMDLALRGRELVSAEDQPQLYWNLTTKVAACLSYLGPAEDAARYLAELRHTTDAEMHMRSSYMTAMLHTRYMPKGELDHELALEWSNISIVLADNYPKPERRTFNGAFMRNGRALVELHRGDLRAALDLVNEAIGMTDSHLGHEEQLLHRSVLTHNRAQVLAAMGEHAAALLDYDDVIRRDPNYGEYYFDRATVRRAAGRDAEALQDYAAAIRLSPPFHEAHYNRADLLRELGDDEGALRDLDYALELEPDHVDSLVNRVDLLLENGEVARATADVDHGLALDPHNARLLSARGSLRADAFEHDAAWADYSAALAEDPALVAAWANRAVLAFTTGRPLQAVDDLTEAIRLADNGVLRMNRAIALQELGNHRQAVRDLDAALAAGADDPDLLYLRGVSRQAVGDDAGARADWEAHLAAYGDEISPHAARIAESVA
ncbi:tetratricopeptide repeat protein [Lentzea sp. NEAU-D13]|uniref:Tetratricopeptide repeat protein n=1 Tax=Lentzea alba TaxID=2714351 RepID=A0A7C9VYE2_9PSEU|nr:tetratricopeptide repeat protein [Lentzea alba]NGY59980.1 tetratricopeptide repeat protein [Lentzea alba]